MDKEGIRDLLEKMLPVSEGGPPTDANDRMVWISDVANAVHKIANTSPEGNKMEEGGRYLCTQVQTSGSCYMNGMLEIECLRVTDKAYHIKENGLITHWIQKSWKIEILEKLG